MGSDTIRYEQVDTLVVKNTISPRSLIVPDSLSGALYADSIKTAFGFPIFDLQATFKNYPLSGQVFQFKEGLEVARGEAWILASIAFLVLLFAFLKNVFARQLLTIIQSFFSNRVLGNLNKEDNLFTSWPFLLLFMQFGFTIGMFFYLVARYKQLDVAADGFPFFVGVSIAIILLYAFKIVVLRLLGFLFSIQKPVNEYVSILYLSYFNASLLFMPLIIAFALSPLKYGEFYMGIAIVLLSIIFTFQLIRAGINILSQYRFSKVYLFLYFCTLEICPILILIRAIGF